MSSLVRYALEFASATPVGVLQLAMAAVGFASIVAAAAAFRKVRRKAAALSGDRNPSVSCEA
jgi:hypothetical protein